MAINYKSLKDHVYKYLSDKIIKGTLKPKERIDISQVCENLKISRSPVREALAQLENERYLEKLPRRGFVVREISVEKVKEIYTIIGCLEAYAASLALSRLTESDLIRLDRLVAKMDETLKKRKLHEYYNLQRKFHDIYILASGNSELHMLISNLKNRFRKQVYSIFENKQTLYDALIKANNQHKQIVKLFKSGEGEEIEQFLRNVHWNIKYAKLDSDHK